MEKIIKAVFLSTPLPFIVIPFSLVVIITTIFTLSKRCRDAAVKITAIFLISIVALIANDITVYIVSLFIIATLFTDRKYLLTLMAIIRGDRNWLDYQKLIVQSDIVKAPLKSEKERVRSGMEFKILNTLWTKQVNYYPDYSKLWGFRINSIAPEYLDFREAVSKLIGEGLVSESEQGQHFLTKRGIKYCAKEYKKFPNPENQYWPDEKIKTENIKTAVKKAEKL